MQKIFKISFLVILAFTLSCKKKKSNTVTNPNQVNTNVNVYIYTNSPEFQQIAIAGNWMYKAGGVSGLIIYRVAMNETNGDFIVYERNCPHEGGTNTNAIVKVKSDNFTIQDTIGCGSKFYMINGSVTQGPSGYPLKQYNTMYNGQVLQIYN